MNIRIDNTENYCRDVKNWAREIEKILDSE